MARVCPIRRTSPRYGRLSAHRPARRRLAPCVPLYLSHPWPLFDSPAALSGAFGSGAAFAFEDAFVLAQALALPNIPIEAALDTYDRVRAPRYRDLHGVLDIMGRNAKDVASLALDDDSHVAEAFKRNWQLENAWIYTYDVSAPRHTYRGEREMLQVTSTRALPV